MQGLGQHPTTPLWSGSPAYLLEARRQHDDRGRPTSWRTSSTNQRSRSTAKTSKSAAGNGAPNPRRCTCATTTSKRNATGCAPRLSLASSSTFSASDEMKRLQTTWDVDRHALDAAYVRWHRNLDLARAAGRAAPGTTLTAWTSCTGTRRTSRRPRGGHRRRSPRRRRCLGADRRTCSLVREADANPATRVATSPPDRLDHSERDQSREAAPSPPSCATRVPRPHACPPCRSPPSSHRARAAWLTLRP